MNKAIDTIKKPVKWVVEGSEVKSLKTSRTIWGTAASFLTRTGAFGTILFANQEAVLQLAEAFGGRQWVIWLGFAIGFLGDFLKTWARIDDHIQGRTK